MNTMKTSMQLALEALAEIRERIEMVEPVFPTLGKTLDIIEAQIHTMGCELKVRESYPIYAVSPTGAKIQRVVEDFENIIHEKCQDIWALVGSVEREKWSPVDLAFELTELTHIHRALDTAAAVHLSKPLTGFELAKMVRDEAAERYRRKYEEEEEQK
jgi:hypothetical protein